VIDELLEALHEYGMAKSEHDSARKEHDGYSWDYHGTNLIDAMDGARERAESAINSIVDDRIQRAAESETDNGR